ncbi:MAG: hypothetical protein NTV34_05865 [Proteobacteria bacterium]|nr:hypothetical protein [Pseudomonadota bacterium]
MAWSFKISPNKIQRATCVWSLSPHLGLSRKKALQMNLLATSAITLMFGCGTVHSWDGQKGEKTKSNKMQPGLDWDELVDNRGKHFGGYFGDRAGISDQAVTSRPGRVGPNREANNPQGSLEGPTGSVSNIADGDLLRWVKDLKIERPRDYEGGVYGKVGSATVYIAPKSKIPDYDRLHWVMVKVLSEKYGCFILRKETFAHNVSVGCRDRRRIVFKRSRGDEWIMFYGRQYDLAGNEVVIVR